MAFNKSVHSSLPSALADEIKLVERGFSQNSNFIAVSFVFKPDGSEHPRFFIGIKRTAGLTLK
ncbi:hypothetical protein [Pedobacter mendelii]|uniref:hypothetical protein n=1 Tax=Pedobacter mendelii TaxID=1908240 RepID=UPI0016687E48|nr:hypothetical protein [Pedobacter mendelii]